MLVFALLIVALPNVLCNICIPRSMEKGIVCVCNATYCDTVPGVGNLPYGEFKMFSTSKSKMGFRTESGAFSNTQAVSSNTIIVNREKKFQTMLGFGGAFTDATGINIKRLPLEAQEKLLESYFGKNGIEYSLCRVPIGGTDFSLRPYSYNDYPDDVHLNRFELQAEDFMLKIPFIKRAIELKQNETFNLFASAWTAPPWMKTNNMWTGYGALKKEYYQLWADYAVKFFDKYHMEGLKFWGMTTGNEPVNGFYDHTKFLINSMAWDPVSMKNWIGEYLGPTIRNSKYRDLKIIAHDDNRLTLPYVLPVLLNDKQSLQYIDGVGIHWYTSEQVPPTVLEDFAKTDEKDIFWLSTESCHFVKGVEIGSWRRAELYLDDIFDNIEVGTVAWVDWNMALNLTGGPTYIDYVADSPILVNATAGEFYKQPMFYALGQFAKFVSPDSVRIDVTQKLTSKEIRTIAFLRPDDMVAVIIYHKGNTKMPLLIQDKGVGSVRIEVEPFSISTFLYRPSSN